MHILLVVPWDQKTGGVASVVRNLARQLTRKGHSVVFLFPGPGNILVRKTTLHGFAGYELQMRAPPISKRALRGTVAFLAMLPSTFLQLAFLILSKRIHVVNIHYPLGGFIYFAFLRRLLRFRLVTSVHGADVFAAADRKEAQRGAYRLLLSSSDHVVAPSRSFRSDIVRVFPHLASRAVFIHNGVDLEEMQELGAAEPAGREDFLLCAATFTPCKGVDTLISAFAIVSKHGDSMRLVLAGVGPLKERFTSLTSALGLEERIDFLGWVDRATIVQLLRRCALFVCPSRAESFGFAVVEAMACGAPVIGSRVGGIEEIISDGHDGLLVPADDPHALAGAIARMLGDGKLREAIAKKGPETIRERFSATRMASAYEELFTGRVQELRFPGERSVGKELILSSSSKEEGRP